MMERRFEQRFPLRIDVRVRDHWGHVLSCPTRDITADGAFIETGRLDLSSEEVLWVDLPDPEVEGGWTDVAALVVHHHSDGVGVMFSHPYTALARREVPLRRERVAYRSVQGSAHTDAADALAPRPRESRAPRRELRKSVSSGQPKAG